MVVNDQRRSKNDQILDDTTVEFVLTRSIDLATLYLRDNQQLTIISKTASLCSTTTTTTTSNDNDDNDDDDIDDDDDVDDKGNDSRLMICLSIDHSASHAPWHVDNAHILQTKDTGGARCKLQLVGTRMAMSVSTNAAPPVVQ